MTIEVKDAYGNAYEGRITKIGRKYVYVEVHFTGHCQTIPFDRSIGRTSQDWEDNKNALPMFLPRPERKPKPAAEKAPVPQAACPACFTIHAGECL